MKVKKSLTRRLMLSIGLIIISMSFLNLLWSVYQYQRQAEAEMKEKAVIITKQLLATRAFIAEKQDIINYDEAGHFEFKKLNPAAVGKGLGEIFTQETGYVLRQTRLQARAPENAPDNFEKEKLKMMAEDPSIDEAWGYDIVEGESVFRYLVPLHYTTECLACHGEPAGALDIAGYQKEGGILGEFAGAISIMFSTKGLKKNIMDNIALQIFYMLVILVATISSTYLIMRKAVITPLQDITKMNARLSETDRLKSEFLAVMSHELRTPLTAIIAFTEALLARRQELSDLQQEYLEDILESAQTLHGQINDVLDMSKIEADMVRLNCQYFRMERVLEGLCYSLGALFAKKGIQFTAEIDPQVPELYADYEKVKHIMQNLLSNAFKFTAEGGRIEVKVVPWQEDVWEGMKVEVRDNGSGISKEDIPYIFDKFWQSDPNRRPHSGSGLGLAIVKNYVELHGGRIWVDSRQNNGAGFIFVLPAGGCTEKIINN